MKPFLEDLDAQNVLPGRYLSMDDYVTLIGPLVRQNIAFDLTLPDCVVARLTWNGGDTIATVFSNGLSATLPLPEGVSA